MKQVSDSKINVVKGKGLVASQLIKTGEKLLSFTGSIVDKPHAHTLQIDESRHLEVHGDPVNCFFLLTIKRHY